MVFPIRTGDIQATVEKICKEHGDIWSDKVQSRIEYAQDLHAANAVYRRACSSNFRTGKQTPLMFQTDDSSQKPTGQPVKSQGASCQSKMQAVSQRCKLLVKETTEKSFVMFLPMIDMSASDMSCVYSTLKFVCAEAKRHCMSPVITFDQPLWWKVKMIITSEPPDSDIHTVILYLGGLHTEMSFLGCMGHIMSRSDLRELLEIVYALNSVNHMLSGKAIYRAFRGHMLVDSALNAMLVAKVFNISLPGDSDARNLEQTTEESSDSGQDAQASESSLYGQPNDAETTPIDEALTKAVEMFGMLMGGEISTEEVCGASNLDNIQERLDQHKTSLLNHRTACLWIGYMEIIRILCQFIKAERTGNWRLHLKTI